jgi:nucleoside-diphosphate-sugar epimerase
LAHQALQQGWQVQAFVRSPESVERLRAQGIEAHLFDLVTGDYEKLARDFKAIVYAASSGGGGLAAYQAIYDVGVKRAVEWAQEAMIPQFIFTSSTSVYRQDDGLEVNESSPTGGTDQAEILLTGERHVLQSSISSRWVLRFGGLYGSGRHYLLDQLRRGEKTIGGRVDHFINYLHRDDAARALWSALQVSRDGKFLYNVTDGQPVTKVELARWLAQRLGISDLSFEDQAPAGPRAKRDGRTAVNRRILSTRFRTELTWKPQFSSVFEGLDPFLLK